MESHPFSPQQGPLHLHATVPARADPSTGGDDALPGQVVGCTPQSVADPAGADAQERLRIHTARGRQQLGNGAVGHDPPTWDRPDNGVHGLIEGRRHT
jgi:hypothetical protein